MMKKGTMILCIVAVMMMTSCSQSDEDISVLPVESSVQPTESTVISEPSEISQPSPIVEQSLDIELSSEEKKIPEESREIAEDSKKLIEKIINVNALGEKTKMYLTDVLEGKELYMNVTGQFMIFGGLTVRFDTEIARSDDGVMEKFTLGENTVKILHNDSGIYIIDDTQKTVLQTDENNFTQNEIANELISYLSSNFGLGSLEYRKNGSENYHGREYAFEEYHTDGSIVKVYFDGDKPVYIVKDNANSLIEIHSLTNAPDKILFQIPESYQLISQ